MKTQTLETQQQLTPQGALELLKEGNARFRENVKAQRDLMQQVSETSDGQWPLAVVLSCIDSRTSTELIFDQGIGDIFSARVAGNFINDDILGSMEFACKVAGAKLVVVLGHSHCGAVKGACDNVELGLLTGMLEKIQPAVDAVTSPADAADRTSANPDFVATSRGRMFCETWRALRHEAKSYAKWSSPAVFRSSAECTISHQARSSSTNLSRSNKLAQQSLVEVCEKTVGLPELGSE